MKRSSNICLHQLDICFKFKSFQLYFLSPGIAGVKMISAGVTNLLKAGNLGRSLLVGVDTTPGGKDTSNDLREAIVAAYQSWKG